MSRREKDNDGPPETLSGLTLDELAPSAFRVFAMLQAVPEESLGDDYAATEQAWRAVAEWAMRFAAEDPGDGEGVPFTKVAITARAVFLVGNGTYLPTEHPLCDPLAWEAVARHLFGAINCEPNEAWKLAQSEATWPAWASRRAAAQNEGVKS